jgi:effector-binding domain-containing protein
MIDTPKVITMEAQQTAMVRLTVPRADIQKVMGPGLAEVKAAVAAQGIETTGPWFTHHLRMDPKLFDFEICLPVKAPITAVGRVKPGNLPPRRVARTVFHGPYEGLGGAWAELLSWMKTEGLAPAADLWEVYLAGPESGPDPAGWRTELNRPLEE